MCHFCRPPSQIVTRGDGQSRPGDVSWGFHREQWEFVHVDRGFRHPATFLALPRVGIFRDSSMLRDVPAYSVSSLFRFQTHGLVGSYVSVWRSVLDRYSVAFFRCVLPQGDADYGPRTYPTTVPTRTICYRSVIDFAAGCVCLLAQWYGMVSDVELFETEQDAEVSSYHELFW